MGPTEYLNYQRLPVEKRKEVFSNLPLVKQVDFYEFFAVDRKCNVKELEIVAMQGEAAIPYLVDRMENSPDSHKVLIANILEKMNESYYEINEVSVKARLRKIVDGMDDPIWKEMTQLSLSKMLEIK